LYFASTLCGYRFILHRDLVHVTAKEGRETGSRFGKSGFFLMASHWPPIMKTLFGVPPSIAGHTFIGYGIFEQIVAV